MDQGLFTKHLQTISKRRTEKQELIAHLKEATGILLEEGECAITKKVVQISTSSVKKAALVQKGVQGVLKGFGYELRV